MKHLMGRVSCSNVIATHTESPMSKLGLQIATYCAQVHYTPYLVIRYEDVYRIAMKLSVTIAVVTDYATKLGVFVT